MAARLDMDLRTPRYLGGAMLALGVILPHLPGNPGLPCPLRTVTGVPCPFCGLTTSVKAALHLDGHGAWAANPFGLLVVAFAIAMVVRPRWRRVSVPALVVIVGVAVSWVFQLHRFHFL
jgi:O-antigen ligase